MTVSAALSSPRLVELLETIPDYAHYRRSEEATEEESPFRIALGRVLKSWGHQLLDMAENSRAPLGQAQARAIDTLLERISEIFQILNIQGDMSLSVEDAERLEGLRFHDGNILTLAEECMGMLEDLHGPEMTTPWLRRNAGALYRRLCRLEEELQTRNKLLLMDLPLGEETRPSPPGGRE